MLKFTGLSGTTSVTENLYVYETEKDIVVVDCGSGFPDSEMLGVDLIIPDFSYLIKQRNKIRAIVVTHGHEDHIGALPFLLKQIRVPVYATSLAAEFIKDKLKEHRVEATVTVFDQEKDILTLGDFKFTPFHISHSIPDGVGFCINTPDGKIFHVADYKFDWTPVTGHPFDVKKAAILASDGVLALVSDSLGSMSPGYTKSEKNIEAEIEQIVRKVKGKVVFTTLSSNMSRIQMAINVAMRTGRKVAFAGYSVDRKAKIANSLGYLNFKKDVVVPAKVLAKKNPQNCIFIAAGAYGQSDSALARIASGDHKTVSVEKGDHIIFSADPAPPGTKEAVDALVDRFYELGVDVSYYNTQENLHVSGHGSQEDIKMLFGIIRPKYYIPVGGTIRHNHGYSQIAQSMGARQDDIFELSPGESVVFEDGKAKRGKKTLIRKVLVDGLGIGDVGNVVLRDRHVLAKDGVVIVLIQVDKAQQKLISDPQLISRGFVFEKENKNFLNETEKVLAKEIRNLKFIDKRNVQVRSVDYLERFFEKETGRRPMILPVIVEI